MTFLDRPINPINRSSDRFDSALSRLPRLRTHPEGPPPHAANWERRRAAAAAAGGARASLVFAPRQTLSGAPQGYGAERGARIPWLLPNLGGCSQPSTNRSAAQCALMPASSCDRSKGAGASRLCHTALAYAPPFRSHDPHLTIHMPLTPTPSPYTGTPQARKRQHRLRAHPLSTIARLRPPPIVHRPAACAIADCRRCLHRSAGESAQQCNNARRARQRGERELCVCLGIGERLARSILPAWSC